MKKANANNIKLGVFVIVGLGFLVLLLYVIGKNQNLFGNTFELKARFENVHGLRAGNNIRFSGIDAGTVKSITLLNDSTIEVTMLIKTKMKNFIQKNATVSISTDGLMGNKLVNILPAKKAGALVEEGDVLYSIAGTDTDDMLRTLGSTNNDIAYIAQELKETARRINSSRSLWSLLEDESLPKNLKASLAQIHAASERMNRMMMNLNAVVEDVRAGKGTIGQLLQDSSLVVEAKEAMKKIQGIGADADTITLRISALIHSLEEKIQHGEGAVHALLSDKDMKGHLDAAIRNIEEAARALQENMEAAKHSILFRGYFKRLDKQKGKTTDY